MNTPSSWRRATYGRPFLKNRNVYYLPCLYRHPLRSHGIFVFFLSLQHIVSVAFLYQKRERVCMERERFVIFPPKTVLHNSIGPCISEP